MFLNYSLYHIKYTQFQIYSLVSFTLCYSPKCLVGLSRNLEKIMFQNILYLYSGNKFYVFQIYSFKEHYDTSWGRDNDLQRRAIQK